MLNKSNLINAFLNIIKINTRKALSKNEWKNSEEIEFHKTLVNNTVFAKKTKGVSLTSN